MPRPQSTNADELQLWVERVAARRRRVLELPLDQQKRGAWLCSLYDTLTSAGRVLRGEFTPSEGLKADLLEDLEALAQEAEAELRQFEAEMSVPKLPA